MTNLWQQIADNNSIVDFYFPITPRGKERARSRVVKTKSGKTFVSHYTPAKTKEYEASLAAIASIEMAGKKLIQGPIEIDVAIILECPKSWPKWKKDLAIKGGIVPTTKPDSDNVLKSIYDSFNGVVWCDDIQVVKGSFDKRYGEKGCMHVTVIELEDVYSSSISKKPPEAKQSIGAIK